MVSVVQVHSICSLNANSTAGLIGLAAPENRIFPEITANGERNVSLKTGDRINIAVSLDPVNQPQAKPVDWWIWRTGPDGTFGYDAGTGLWEEGLHPIKLSVFRILLEDLMTDLLG